MVVNIDWRASKTINGLRNRYSFLPPLLFQRTIERSRSGSEAFDILESVPQIYPIVWDETTRRWIIATDMWLDREKS